MINLKLSHISTSFDELLQVVQLRPSKQPPFRLKKYSSCPFHHLLSFIEGKPPFFLLKGTALPFWLW
jgi:hypothetical protein